MFPVCVWDSGEELGPIVVMADEERDIPENGPA